MFNEVKIILVASLIIILSASAFYLLLLESNLREQSYDLLIEEIAQKYEVDVNLIKSIIKQESNFLAKIRGKAGEYGLMQITEGAVKDWQTVTKNEAFISEHFLFRPEINIDIGTWYISRSLKKWKESPYQKIYALTEYNAGAGNLKKWLKNSKKKGYDVIKFKSTKSYIKSILENYKKLSNYENE